MKFFYTCYKKKHQLVPIIEFICIYKLLKLYKLASFNIKLFN